MKKEKTDRRFGLKVAVLGLLLCLLGSILLAPVMVGQSLTNEADQIVLDNEGQMIWITDYWASFKVNWPGFTLIFAGICFILAGLWSWLFAGLEGGNAEPEE